MNKYLIPANSKKSQLWLGFFTTIDAILFLSGCIMTVILLLIFQNPSLGGMIVMLTPVLVTGFLVLPVPHYHNMLQLITNVLTYYTSKRRYLWRGWCVRDE